MLRNPQNSKPTSPQPPSEKNREPFVHVSRKIITNSQMQGWINSPAAFANLSTIIHRKQLWIIWTKRQTVAKEML